MHFQVIDHTNDIVVKSEVFQVFDRLSQRERGNSIYFIVRFSISFEIFVASGAQEGGMELVISAANLFANLFDNLEV